MITRQNGPEIDKDEEAEEELLVQWEDEGEDVVREGLRVAVERVEGV